MDTQTIRAILQRIQIDVAAVLDLTIVRVRAGENLQAALDQRGIIELEAGAIYSGSFTLGSGTTLVGHGASIIGTTLGPALSVPVGVSDIVVSDLTVTGAYGQLIRVGRNDSTQTTFEQVPQRITFTRVKVPSHRGTRAFEINGAYVSLIDCEVAETWSPALQDSQAVCILNTPGPVLIQGGSFAAGSENIMVGGDTMKIPGVIPTGITIKGARIYKPASWKPLTLGGDGVNRAVKNLLEFKTGKDVLVNNCTITGCWTASQDGPGIVLTPKSGGDVHNVVIEDCLISDVSYAIQFGGQDYHLGAIKTPSPLSGVIVRRNHIAATKANSNGTGNGYLAKGGGAPIDLTFDSNVVKTDGSTIFVYDNGIILGPDNTTQIAAGPIEKLVFTNNYALPATYAFNLDGNMNLGGNSLLWVMELIVTGNTFGAPYNSLFKTKAPNNTYVTRAEWDTLVNGQ